MSQDDPWPDRPRGDLPGPVPGSLLDDRFELREPLGEGAIGRVWSAFDRQLREEVAVKLLRPELATAPEVVARFEREVRLARRVTHPGVCRTHDQGRDERFGPFITMERLHGETLAERVRRHGPFPPREAARLISAIADALAAAHGAGVVHRDLKTANVMLVTADDGVQPVLTDFGLARCALVEAGDTATASGQVVGSPAYMAPEQVLGEAGARAPTSTPWGSSPSSCSPASCLSPPAPRWPPRSSVSTGNRRRPAPSHRGWRRAGTAPSCAPWPATPPCVRPTLGSWPAL